MLAVTTIGFDIAASSSSCRCCGGACAVVAPRETVQDVPGAGAAYCEARATAMQATPTLVQSLLSVGGGRLPDLGTLRCLFTGGEALPGELARALRVAEAGNS